MAALGDTLLTPASGVQARSASADATADVFISYARENRRTAEQLARALSENSLRVWWDHEIPAGAEFADVIATQLLGARVVVALWSAESVRSGFVRDESSRALAAGKLLPVRIEEVELPLGFGQIHTLDLLDWDGDGDDESFLQLLAEIERLKGQPRPAAVRVFPRRRWLRHSIIGLLVVLTGVFLFAAKNNWDARQAESAFQQGLERQFAKEPNLESARNLYLSALEHDRAHARARYYLAHVYAQLGQSGDARRAFELALRRGNGLDDGQRATARLQLAALAEAQEPAAVTRVAQASTPPQTSPAQPGPAPKPADDHPSSQPEPAPPPPPADPAIKLPTPIEPPSTAQSRITPLVDKMFDENKDARITATTTLVLDPEALSDAVPLAVNKALELLRLPDSGRSASAASGIVNTLVLLQSALPGTLNARRESIEQLIGAARSQGDYTRQQAGKVATLLKQAQTRKPVAFIQIASESQRPLAQALATRFQTFGYDAPAIERVEGRAPNRTELRIQGKSERGYARWVAKVTSEITAGEPAVSTLRNANPATDTYEIWLGRDLCAPGGRVLSECGG